MAKAFVAHVCSGRGLDPKVQDACKEVVKSLRSNPDSSEKLMGWAVEWVERNPEPIALQPPSYRR